ncbi:MAG: hypothetical protein H6713_26790 [Myxococcales bacterium]|nr:hypothetical protein [Myxococcales bacterium]
MISRRAVRRGRGHAALALTTGAAVGLLSLGAGLTLGACLSFPTDKQCKRACVTARGCGLLPSALGGSNTDTIDEAQTECELRCQSTLLDEGSQLSNLLTLLESIESASLCTETGREACAALNDSIASDAALAGVQVTSELTIVMADVRSYVAAFAAGEWCTSSYFGAEATAVMYAIAAPSKACLDAMETASDCATIQGLHDDPAEDADCRFVRRSQVAALAGLRAEVDGCLDDQPQSIESIREIIADLKIDWELGSEGMLIIDGAVDSDLENLQVALNERADRELRGIDGVLRDVCEAYELEQGSAGTGTGTSTGTGTGTGTGTAEDGELLSCNEAPLCRDLDCETDVIHCDPALCDISINGPSRDCGLLGIDSIQLGYESGGVRVLSFEESGLGCDDATATQTFGAVPLAEMSPIATISGTLPQYLIPVNAEPTDDNFDDDRGYSWHVEGQRRWTRAGTSRLVIPSPLLRFLEARYSNPLEMLGWVNTRLPESEACNEQLQQCEAYFNNNCDDGLDNDENGLTDREEPWCDALFNELADVCLVAHQALKPNPNCEIDDDEP